MTHYTIPEPRYRLTDEEGRTFTAPDIAGVSMTVDDVGECLIIDTQQCAVVDSQGSVLEYLD